MNGHSAPESTDSARDAHIHTLAIAISRQLNLLNPNDTLAKRMLQLVDVQPNLEAFSKAASSFGRFQPAFLEQVYKDAKAQSFGTAPLLDTSPDEAIKGRIVVGNLHIQDHDVMAPSAARAGGLAQTKRPGLTTSEDGAKHVFVAPQSSKHSLLGLDRLAMEKRKEKADESDRDRKRAKLSGNDEDDSLQSNFKGACFISSALCSANLR